MLPILITSIAILILLLFTYIRVRKNVYNTLPFVPVDFGKGIAKKTPKIVDTATRKQLLRQQNIAFIAYLVSLAVSFILGAIAIFKIINNELDWKFLGNALSISGGVVATVSFRRLYTECVKNLKV